MERVYSSKTPNATRTLSARDSRRDHVERRTGTSRLTFDRHLPAVAVRSPGSCNQRLPFDAFKHFPRSEHHRVLAEVGVTGRLGGQMEVMASAGLCTVLEDFNRWVHVPAIWRRDAKAPSANCLPQSFAA